MSSRARAVKGSTCGRGSDRTALPPNRPRAGQSCRRQRRQSGTPTRRRQEPVRAHATPRGGLLSTDVPSASSASLETSPRALLAATGPGLVGASPRAPLTGSSFASAALVVRVCLHPRGHLLGMPFGLTTPGGQPVLVLGEPARVSRCVALRDMASVDVLSRLSSQRDKGPPESFTSGGPRVVGVSRSALSAAQTA